jgi:CheY-like chemotaxis protein
VTTSSILRPRVVVISDGPAFTRLVRTLLDDLNLVVRSSSVAQGAVILVDSLQPGLVILDLTPGQEAGCWQVLEALNALPSTRDIAVLLCQAAPWLIDGHQDSLAGHEVRIWCDPFDLRDLLEQIEAALDERAGVPAMPTQPCIPATTGLGAGRSNCEVQHV